MDEDDYPNFGSAFPDVPPKVEKEAGDDMATANETEPQQTEAQRQQPGEEDDDFFDRYPNATPKKQAQRPAEGESNEEPFPGSPSRSQSIVEETGSTQQGLGSSTEPAAELETQGVTEATNDHAQDKTEEDAETATNDSVPVIEQDEERVVLQPDDTAQEQAQQLEEYAPKTQDEEPQLESRETLEHIAQTGALPSSENENRPEERYEHQGEVTEMEIAQDESENAPLMEDEEPAPTPGLASRQPTFVETSGDLDSGSDADDRPPSQPLHRPHKSMDRSFTTNFTDLPKHEVEDDGEAQEDESRPIVDEDWPAAGDDRTFGDLLDSQAQSKQAPQEADLPGAPEPASELFPVTEEDDAFGELLGSQPREDLSFEQLIGQEASMKSAPPAAPAEEDLSAAWAAALDDDDILDEKEIDPKDFFGDDDEGLLEDEEPFLADMPSQPPASTPGQGSEARSAYTPAAAQQPRQSVPYTAPSTPFLGQFSARGSGTPDTGLFDVYNQPGAIQQSQEPQRPPQRPALSSAQSFADKAKTGYQSPYDLPMEVVKPRRRPQQPPTPAQAPVPPPRSSSFHGVAPGQPPSAPPPANMTPPTSSHSNRSMPPPSTPGANPPVPPKTTPKTDSGFFADLPMATKPRVRPSGAYTPQPSGMPTPPIPPQRQMPPRAASYAPTSSAQTAPIHQPPQPAMPPVPIHQPPTASSLRQPEKNPLFPEQPLSAPQVQEIPPSPAVADRYSPSSHLATAPPATSRYSPAPVPNAQAPPAPSRYSPAPAQQSQQQPKTASRYSSATTAAPPPLGRTASQFAPRTSSPLAMHGRPGQGQQEVPETPRSTSFSPISHPPTNGLTSAMGLSPERRGSNDVRYTPPSTSGGSMPEATAGTPHTGPPQRPRTQSPGSVMKMQKTGYTPSERRGSSGHAPAVQPPSGTNTQTLPTRLAHRRQFSRDLPFAAPQDERAQDPMQRWRGHPIFQWSPSGSVLSCFPKQTPFYAAGQALPSIKCTPGPIVVQDATTFMPLNDRDAKFPGPLSARSKGKKKEVMAWLSGKIEDLERETEGAMLDFNLPTDEKKRVEEKLVLWKIMRVYLEYDGTLEGNPKIEEEVRRILLPNLAQMSQVADLQSPVSATAQPDAVDPQVLAQLRQALFEGQRERAVWLAEEKKLWGHAMLLASTMGPEVWKQIVASFVRSQVRSVGSDARSLAALYQVFAGNSEDCVDELVPPSARAGFQMISKTDGSRAGNPLEGMDQWRETLALIISNRTPSDPQSLIALGKLLASYGRVEAAHTCYLFARQVAKHSGADDIEAHFVLLGADHTTGDTNLDAILLTEIYEYATSLSAPSTAVHYLPHLQAYKLAHGQQLAAHGLRQKAESYTAHIDSTIRSTTRPSGYYHQSLAQELIAFNAFLSQTPHAGDKGKFFSRPAMDKVSSGVGSWFTKFVSGDEAETASNSFTPGQITGAGDTTAGPFGGVDTNQGSISRSASGTDLYNPMMAAAATPLSAPFQPSPAGASSRYAPGAQQASAANRYAPAVPSQFAPSRSSMDSDRSYEPQTPQQSTSLGMPSSEPIRPASARYASYAPQAQGQQSPQMLGVPRPGPERATSDYSVPYDGSSRRGSAYSTSALSTQSYEPKPLHAEQDGYGYGDQAPHTFDQPPIDPEGGVPPTNEPADPETGSGYEPPAPTSGYEPPGSNSYEPPSYQPYQPDSPSDSPPKRLKPKKSIMDLSDSDDDITARAASLKKSQQSSADAAADAAFRAAAEADAARDSKTPADGKKGWFGGWFGKKDPNGLGAGNAPGPIRAKLGEENSFYFDKDLGKWVNKKGGSEAATPAAATPPPPRGPPSGAMGPPSRAASGAPVVPGRGPPSRAGTPASVPPMPLKAGGEGGFAPPQRPASGMSNASSLDDLMAAPKKAAGTVRGKKKGGRYVDVMAGK